MRKNAINDCGQNSGASASWKCRTVANVTPHLGGTSGANCSRKLERRFFLLVFLRACVPSFPMSLPPRVASQSFLPTFLPVLPFHVYSVFYLPSFSCCPSIYISISPHSRISPPIILPPRTQIPVLITEHVTGCLLLSGHLQGTVPRYLAGPFSIATHCSLTTRWSTQFAGEHTITRQTLSLPEAPRARTRQKTSSSPLPNFIFRCPTPRIVSCQLSSVREL